MMCKDNTFKRQSQVQKVFLIERQLFENLHQNKNLVKVLIENDRLTQTQPLLGVKYCSRIRFRYKVRLRTGNLSCMLYEARL